MNPAQLVVGAVVVAAIVLAVIEIHIALRDIRTLWYPLVRAYLEARAKSAGNEMTVLPEPTNEPPRFHVPDGHDFVGMFNTREEEYDDEDEV